MTRRRLAALLLTATALGVTAAPALADVPAAADQLRKTHVVCVGGSNDPSGFDGVCVWVPLPV